MNRHTAIKGERQMMRWKYPIRYELTPEEIDVGIHWLTLKLKNVGTETLREVDVRLHSMDTYYLSVIGEGHYLTYLKPDEEREFAFRVNATGSADVYATFEARREGNIFWWESGHIRIRVGEEKAEIERFLVLSHPYAPIGRAIQVEATIKGLRSSMGLDLNFWADSPSGKYEELARIETKELAAGEEAKYTAEFTPKETGTYQIYAYLHDGYRRIGSKTDCIYAQKG